MCWSVIKQEGKEYSPHYLFQQFTQEEWDAYPFAGEEKLKWFRDGKLGLFLHVGISAIGKVDIGWPRHTHKLPDPNVGAIPDEIYDGWADQFKIENFNAEEWIDLAVAGGFKYVVIITKHHDGFHMWDTRYSEHKVTNTPMGRDYLRELTDACHKKNMPVGLYYSQRDWYHPDYEPVSREDAEPIPQIPFYRMKEGRTLHAGERHEEYIRYMHNAVLELMENYGKIDILWWDASWYDDMYTAEMWRTLEIEGKVRERQPHILINNRASVPGDFDTPECRVGFVQRGRAWETCMPLGKAWAWTDGGLKPFKEVMHQFLSCVCGDGNYLLSIGMMPDGRIAPEETEQIRRIGDWLRQYGEAVYGTRSGPWNPGNYGGSVYRDNVIYLHILNRPSDGMVRFPLRDYRIVKMECMTGESPRMEVRGGYLELTVPDTEFVDMVIRLDMEENVGVEMGGIDVGEWKDRFTENPVLYGGVLYCAGAGEGSSVIRLDACRKVTAVVVPECKGELRLETSVDGKAWEECYCGSKESVELELSSYVAGAPVCGKNAGSIRVHCENPVKKIIIYGM